VGLRADEVVTRVANPFDDLYAGTPPWDIGRPQQAFVALSAKDAFGDEVLDAGCGTGELALFLAAKGHDVVGVDASGKAIERARGKAKQRALSARFVVGDALRLEKLARSFDSIVDCGLFHTLTDAGRGLYVQSLQRVLRPGGTLHLLCFSDDEPEWGGPRRVKRAELLAAFHGGWWVDAIAPARMESNISEDGARAWLLSASYEGKPVESVQ
jgi:ubiquinone/menaquinone biosynthesis C-methylase UbiE